MQNTHRRRTRSRLRLLAALALMLSISGCLGDATGIHHNPLDPDAVAPIVTVAPSTVSLGWIGASLHLSATLGTGATPEGIRFSWRSLNESVIAVDNTGHITAISEGMAKVVVSVMNLTDTATVTVLRVPAAISLSSDTLLFLEVGKTQTVSATVADGGGQALSGSAIAWTSSDEAVATVSDGAVTSKGGGLARITATSGAASASVQVRVATGPATVTVDPAAVSFTALGDTAQLVATVRDAAGGAIDTVGVSYISSDTSVASVGAGGLVLAVGVGNASIKVQGDTVSTTVPVTVSQIAAQIELALRTATLTLNGTLQLSGTATDRNGHPMPLPTVLWSSSDTTVVVVSQTGLLAGVDTGTAVVRAASGEVSDSALITVVNEPVARIEISPMSLTVGLGQTGLFTASTFGEGGAQLFGPVPTWTSASVAVATVSATGSVTGIAVGSTWIMAALGATTDSARVMVTKTPPTIASISPPLLVPGAEGVLVGTDFGTSLADVTLRVDSVTAVVTSVTSTRVTFTVPSYSGQCLPRTLRSVRLEVDGVYSDWAGTSVATTANPVTVNPGSYVLLSPEEADCTFLDELSTGEDYLVAVQSYAPTPGLYPYTWSSWETSLPSGVASVSSRVAGPTPISVTQVTGFGEAQRVELDSLLRSLRAAGIRVTDADRPQQRAPGAAPAVGDIRTFYTSASEQITTRAVAVGQSIVVYLDDAAPVVPSAGLLAQLVEDYDVAIGPGITQGIGPIPDHDGNSLVSMVLTPQVNLIGWPENSCRGGAVGFVRGADWFPQAIYASSNVADVFFALTPDPAGAYGCSLSEGLVSSNIPATMAHEVVHIVDLDEKLRRSQGTIAEDLWLSEAKAQTGTEAVMDYLVAQGKTEEATPYYLYLLNSVRGFLGSGSLPETSPLVQVEGTANYGLVWLFGSWLRGAYGTSDFKRTIFGSEVGVDAVEAALGISGTVALAQFGVALHDGGDRRMGSPLNLPKPVRRSLATLGSTYYLDAADVVPTRASGTASYGWGVYDTSMSYERFLPSATTDGLVISVRNSNGEKLTAEPLQVVVWRRAGS